MPKKLKFHIFWDVTTCRPVHGHRTFRGLVAISKSRLIFTNRYGVNFPKRLNLHKHLISRTERKIIFRESSLFGSPKKYVRVTTRAKLEKLPRRSVGRPSSRCDILLPTEMMRSKTYDKQIVEEIMLEQACNT